MGGITDILFIKQTSNAQFKNYFGVIFRRSWRGREDFLESRKQKKPFAFAKGF
ncbi:Uncharacterised protein [Serratia grimesii]|nr:Uncharacterised protein [Serratia grimesii]CAI2522177.1 Uncharacterised protein [Serratia grimesii]CAI2793102.1 Uncharacterised protein [Serratia grimesii]